MAAPPRRRRRSQQRRSEPWWKRLGESTATEGVPVSWMCLTGLLYGATGVILSAFPAPYWIWNLALGGAIAQALALAGPKALRRFRWWSANVLALLAILGTFTIAIALSVALGYVGTDNLDEVMPATTAFEIIRSSLIALVIAASGAIVGAETGDRLLGPFSRLQTTLILAATSILSMGFGGIIGFLVTLE